MRRIHSLEEELSSRDRKLVDKIYRRGDVVLHAKDTSKNVDIKLYSVLESRGYQTDFDNKEFFYMIASVDSRIQMVQAVSRGLDGRKNKDMLKYWEDNFLVLVEDQDALDRWLAR